MKLEITQKKNALLETNLMEFKDMVKKTFMTPETRALTASLNEDALLTKDAKKNTVLENEEDDWFGMDGYFGSYAETEIHESMLKVHYPSHRIQSELKATVILFTTTRIFSREKWCWMSVAEPVFSPCLRRKVFYSLIISRCCPRLRC